MDPILETQQMQEDQRSADDRRRSFARRQESMMERVSNILSPLNIESTFP